MKNENLLMFCLDWLAANTPLLVQLFTALVPVLAISVAGYAIYTVERKHRRGKK